MVVPVALPNGQDALQRHDPVSEYDGAAGAGAEAGPEDRLPFEVADASGVVDLATCLQMVPDCALTASSAGNVPRSSAESDAPVASTKRRNAARVRGPDIPSAMPALQPRAFS